MDPAQRFRVDGKVALVSGASYGLGVLFAETLADASADLVITARSQDRLQAVAEQIRARGRRCLAVEADVTSYDDCARAVAAAQAEFGRLDILVNNAGWADDSLVRSEHADPAAFHKMVMTDLVGLFYMTRAAAPLMLRQGGGSIINLSSIFGMAGSENRTASYSPPRGASTT